MFRKKSSAQRYRGQRVVAAVDLPGVPAGTTGRIKVVNGFSWTRYWVLFDNGADLGSVDGSQLTFVDKDGQPLPA